MEECKEDVKNGNTEKTDYSEILELYGCDDEPMAYMIEPRGTVRYVDENHKTTVEELQNILPEISQ